MVAQQGTALPQEVVDMVPGEAIPAGTIITPTAVTTVPTSIAPVEAGKYTSWLCMLKRVFWVEKRP